MKAQRKAKENVETNKKPSDENTCIQQDESITLNFEEVVEERLCDDKQENTIASTKEDKTLQPGNTEKILFSQNSETSNSLTSTNIWRRVFWFIVNLILIFKIR